jgi:tripartite-type tricarboxylate transporter receptor subunit TctC
VRAIIAAFALCAFCFLAHAQPVASRTVHLIVPYTPATGADILARALGPKLQERWKVAVVTENKPGATGNIGAEFVAKAPADGTTLLVAATSFATNPALNSAPYDPVKSFAPVIVAATSALCVVVNPQVPAQSMKELIEAAKRQPGKLNYGSPGNGGVQHLAMELIKIEAGIDLRHVPYKGMGGMLNDLVGGHIQTGVSALQSASPHVHAGRLRMLAVMSAERSSAFPNVPTMREQGLPELEVETWYGVFAPAGTPSAALAKLNADFDALLQDAQMREFLARQGMSAGGGPAERLGELVPRELARWTRVVRLAGIKAD